MSIFSGLFSAPARKTMKDLISIEEGLLKEVERDRANPNLNVEMCEHNNSVEAEARHNLFLLTH